MVEVRELERTGSVGTYLVRLLTLVRVGVEDRPRADEVDRRKDDVDAAANPYSGEESADGAKQTPAPYASNAKARTWPESAALPALTVSALRLLY